MADDRRKWISIMIVPEDGSGMWKWRITSRRFTMLRAGLWTAGAFLVVGMISMVLVAVLLFRISGYRRTNAELLGATAKLTTITGRLDRYEEKERRLRAILGSDLDLPEAAAPAPADLLLDDGGGETADSALPELSRAIVREEARARRYPTAWPVEAWQITIGFVHTGDPRTDHLGIDILAPRKTPVVAAGDGIVTYAGTDRDLGNLVVIDHGNGWETHYGHNESLLVGYGATVRKGQPVAVFGGSGGQSTGEHLHFAMYYRGRPVNPLDWLEKRPLVPLSGE